MFRRVTYKLTQLKPAVTCTSKARYSSEKKFVYGPRFEDNEKFEPYDDDEFIMENPLKRTIRILKRDFVIGSRRLEDLYKEQPHRFDPDDFSDYSVNIFPNRADIVIIGGGAIGSSIAYFIKQRFPKDLEVVVLEKDPTYKNASTALSVGGLRQQFSFEENIKMSLFGADFLRNAGRLLSVEGEEPVNVKFRPYGYMFLATEKGAECLQENSRLQNAVGARNVLLTPNRLKSMFPWINTEGIALGCLGVQNEGWFDPYALLMGFKKKAISLGVQYVTAEAKGFVFEDASPIIDIETNKSIHRKPYKIVVQPKNGPKRAIEFAVAIVACGAHSSRIAKMAGIGTGQGPLSVPLPVEPRKRYVYCFHCPDGPSLNTPLTIDPSGAYFRREGLGGLYICGQSPEFDNEPPIDNLNVDEQFFYDNVWPNLAKRVPAFENLKLKSSWAGFYEHNYYDGNGIVGMHPYYGNIMFATGFSGHGIQQSPAVGRAVMELLVHSRFMTIDLTRMGFNRFMTLEPMEEKVIV